MTTEIKSCPACHRNTVHNMLKGGKDWRCTKCGHPPATGNLGRKEFNIENHQRQLYKVRLGL